MMKKQDDIRALILGSVHMGSKKELVAIQALTKYIYCPESVTLLK